MQVAGDWFRGGEGVRRSTEATKAARRTGRPPQLRADSYPRSIG
jgi:hypothetical protein